MSPPPLDKTIFLIGPGFIGSALLPLLSSAGYTVTALTRRKAWGDFLLAHGASRIILSSLSDHATIAAETAAASITIHTATADDHPSVRAVLDGLARRSAAGNQSIYIHTSGTGVLDDGSSGDFRGSKVFDDSDPAGMDDLPDDAPHRSVDLMIVRKLRGEPDGAAEAGFAGLVRGAIMVPPEIYGYNKWNGRITIQIPTIARFALKHGYAGHVGKGLSVESSVHVNDLARGYVYLLHHLEANGPEATRANPYFYCESGDVFEWREVARQVGRGLWEAGRIESPGPRAFEVDKYADLFGEDTPWTIGLNSLSRASRLRELGWTPKEKSIWESLHEDELPAILEQWDREHAGEKVK